MIENDNGFFRRVADLQCELAYGILYVVSTIITFDLLDVYMVFFVSNG